MKKERRRIRRATNEYSLQVGKEAVGDTTCIISRTMSKYFVGDALFTRYRWRERLREVSHLSKVIQLVYHGRIIILRNMLSGSMILILPMLNDICQSQKDKYQVYKVYLEQSNLQEQRIERWLPGAGRTRKCGSCCLISIKGQLYQMKKFQRSVAQLVPVVNTALHT